MWMGHDGGLAASMYGPCQVNMTYATESGDVRLSITETTQYPFSENITMRISLSEQGEAGYYKASSSNIKFPLFLRVPGWLSQNDVSGGMEVEINGQPTSLSRDEHLQSYLRVERSWSNGDVVSIRIALKIRAAIGKTVTNGWTSRGKLTNKKFRQGQGNADSDQVASGNFHAGHMNVTADLPFCTVERGPLLFSLALHSESEQNTTSFNYGIICNANTMHAIVNPRFPNYFNWSLANAPVQVVVNASKILWSDPWLLPDEAVQPLNTSSQRLITLAPYGCTKMYRISMFPIIATSNKHAASKQSSPNTHTFSNYPLLFPETSSVPTRRLRAVPKHSPGT